MGMKLEFLFEIEAARVAIMDVLGLHIHQAGSWCSPDRFGWDDEQKTADACRIEYPAHPKDEKAPTLHQFMMIVGRCLEKTPKEDLQMNIDFSEQGVSFGLFAWDDSWDCTKHNYTFNVDEKKLSDGEIAKAKSTISAIAKTIRDYQDMQEGA